MMKYILDIYIIISIVKQLIQPIKISVYMPGIGDWGKTDIMLSLAYISKHIRWAACAYYVLIISPTILMVIPNIFAICVTAMWSVYEPPCDISSM